MFFTCVTVCVAQAFGNNLVSITLWNTSAALSATQPQYVDVLYGSYGAYGFYSCYTLSIDLQVRWPLSWLSVSACALCLCFCM